VNRLQRRKLQSRLAAAVCLAFGLVAVFPLFSLLYEVWMRGHSVVSWTFLTSDLRFVVQPGVGLAFGGGVRYAIVGTGIVVGLASLIGAPVGVAAGIFLSEYGRNRLGDAIRTVVDAMAGIPSIVAGLFGFAVVAARWGYSAWAGAVALAVLMVPTVTRTTEEALRTVPQSLRDASLALGGPRWYTTLRVVIPAAAGPIVTGLLLGVARIAGETAPLLLTVLGVQFYNADPTKPVATMQGLLYGFINSSIPSEQAMGWGTALVFILAILLLNVTVRILARSRRKLA
jgi:phosphate transport system permease protein